MIQLKEYGVPFNGADEDRACVAVAFAWAWTEFAVETDGESRPGNIIFKPTDAEHISLFMEKFVPALNAELHSHGFNGLTQYGTPSYFYDLDDPDDLPSMMDMHKVLYKNGTKYTFAEMRDIGKPALAAQVRAITGSRFFELDTFGKAITFRNQNGTIQSSPS